MSTSSYSSLLRRSKLASYSPNIEQVYSTTGGHLARSSFGLKRPLPASAASKKAPFIRVTNLDNKSKRTEYRKATRETIFTKKWSEVHVGIGVNQQQGAPPLAGEVQSRFVPARFGAGEGGIKSVHETLEGAHVGRRAPNVLLMTEVEFEQFLDSLGERREEFRQFALEELQKTKEGEDAVELDLYEHAQLHPTHLTRLVERFLAIPIPSPATAPTPQTHPTLALQYSSPTPLESSLSPPLPGRLLGPSPSYQAHSHRPMSITSNRSQLYTTILGQIAPIGVQQSAGTPYTTFFPDASSTRSNQPGRASFTIRPTINAQAFANRLTLASTRGNAPFRPTIPAWEPQALAAKTLDLHPVVSSTSPRPLPGTQAYSGNLPPAPLRHQGGGGGGGARGAGAPSLLSELMPSSGSFGHSRRLREPRTDLYNGRRLSWEQNERFRKQGQALMEERRAVDGKVFGSQRREAQARKGEKVGAGGEGKRSAQRQGLVDQLSSLLKGQ